MKELVPSEFLLSQNFPNPFKDSTKIKYCLPVITKINITVFNSDGEKVKELVNNIQEAGTYEVKLESSDLPAGFYYYRLEADDFVDTKKMTLIK